jgi:hypothetical protein
MQRAQVSNGFLLGSYAKTPTGQSQWASRVTLAASTGYTIGATGFEPATSCSRSRRSTGLSYAPLILCHAEETRLEGLEPPTF